MRELIRRKFEVDVPLEAAWQHLAQVEEWPSWARHIKQVELTPKGELMLTTVGRFRLAGEVSSDFKMIELNPFQNWKWVGPFLWLVVQYDHRFERVDEKRTKLIWLVSAEGFGISVLGRLFAAIYNRNLDRAIPLLIREMGSLS